MQYDGYCVIEQRRADCNFETAYLFLLAGRALGETKYYDIAVNLLDYLYFRSGLLNRTQKEYPAGSWNWSHIKRESHVYFDDEAWCVFLQLKIAEEYPELDKKYGMKSWGMILGEELLTATELVMDKKDLDNAGHWIDASGRWLGRLDLPHWGALACMALAKVYQENHGRKYADTVKRYHEYMASRAEEFIVSEQAYAIIGACAAYRYTGDEYYRKLAERFAHLVMKKMDADGNIPAEHYEAPAGKHLVDTIYTVNWALLGMQALAAVSEEARLSGEQFRVTSIKEL